MILTRIHKGISKYTREDEIELPSGHLMAVIEVGKSNSVYVTDDAEGACRIIMSKITPHVVISLTDIIVRIRRAERIKAS